MGEDLAEVAGVDLADFHIVAAMNAVQTGGHDGAGGVAGAMVGAVVVVAPATIGPANDVRCELSDGPATSLL